MKKTKTLDSIVQSVKENYLTKAIPLSVGLGIGAAWLLTGHYYHELTAIAPAALTAASTTMENISPNPLTLEQFQQCVPLASEMVRNYATHLYNSYKILLPVTTAIAGMTGAAGAYVWHNFQEVKSKAINYYHETIEPFLQKSAETYRQNIKDIKKGVLWGGFIAGAFTLIGMHDQVLQALDYIKNYDQVQNVGQYLSRIDKFSLNCIGNLILATPVERFTEAVIEHVKTYSATLGWNFAGGGVVGGLVGALWGEYKDKIVPSVREIGKQLRDEIRDVITHYKK